MQRQQRQPEKRKSKHNFCHNLSWHFFATFLALSFSLSHSFSHSLQLARSRSNNFKFNSPFCGGNGGRQNPPKWANPTEQPPPTPQQALPPHAHSSALTAILWFLLLAFYYICLRCRRCAASCIKMWKFLKTFYFAISLRVVKHFQAMTTTKTTTRAATTKWAKSPATASKS